MRVRIQTTWIALPRSGPSRASVCAWTAARRARFFLSTCCWSNPIQVAPASRPTTISKPGALNPNVHGPRMRTVYLRHDRTTPPVDEDGEVDQSLEARGQFIPCGCCGEVARFGRTTVQDHQTKGDQPFQALVAKQIQIQPANAVEAQPLRPASRTQSTCVLGLAAGCRPPRSESANVFDERFPALPDRVGLQKTSEVAHLSPLLSLDDLYLAILLASKKLSVRLRPELKAAETFAAEDTVELAVQEGSADTDNRPAVSSHQNSLRDASAGIARRLSSPPCRTRFSGLRRLRWLPSANAAN